MLFRESQEMVTMNDREIIKRQLGRAITEFRHALRIRQSDFAGRLGISPAMLNHIEKGRREASFMFFVELRRRYGISLDDLIDEVVREIDNQGAGVTE